MKVKVRRKKPAPTGTNQPTFKSTIEVLRELVPEYGTPKMAWFKRLIKERIRKEPAPIAAEQAKKEKNDVIVKFVVNCKTVSESKLTQKISF